LKVLNDIGISAIETHLEKLTDQLCEQLLDTAYEVVSSRRTGEKSQIVCIRNTSGLSSMDLYTHLRKRNIITAPRGERLRISPHFYNTHEEIDELVKALP
jgi:cysteine desulfurase/selenocysteine lyase